MIIYVVCYLLQPPYCSPWEEGINWECAFFLCRKNMVRLHFTFKVKCKQTIFFLQDAHIINSFLLLYLRHIDAISCINIKQISYRIFIPLFSCNPHFLTFSDSAHLLAHPLYYSVLESMWFQKCRMN